MKDLLPCFDRFNYKHFEKIKRLSGNFFHSNYDKKKRKLSEKKFWSFFLIILKLNIL